jgi:hypothetical protein
LTLALITPRVSRFIYIHFSPLSPKEDHLLPYEEFAGLSRAGPDVLFVGAAKEAGQAAKGNSWRDSGPTAGCKSNVPLLSRHAPTPEEVHDQRNRRYN